MRQGNYRISFEELARRGKKILENRKSVTFEYAKEQVERLKKNSKCGKDRKENKEAQRENSSDGAGDDRRA